MIRTMSIKIDLPDFEDMMNVAERIKKLKVECSILDIKIKEIESNIVKTVTTTSSFFIGGKPPSMEYIKTVYLTTGLSGELVPLRLEFYEKQAEVEEMKSILGLKKDKIDVWRTIQSNERASLL